jgi:hypothetical protein
MHFALVNGLQAEPSPGLHGVCKNCEAVMISKCGQHKLWHWAHKSRINCDPWWEPETEWHRQWKNHFPADWQEIIQFDPVSNEKHIADVKTIHDQVIEFQHSPMKPDELRSREAFYKNMVWIVDGCRGFSDATYFNLGLCERIDPENGPTIFPFHWYGRSKLIENWIAATCPVFLDFGHNVAWRLVSYDRVKKLGIVGPIEKEDLVKILLEGTPVARIRTGDE